ncbi:MAG: hypothetical protein R3F60_31365 [bacterium]
MRLIPLIAALALAACQSNALSLSSPGSYGARFEPDYLEGDGVSTLILTFDDIDDPGDATGDPATWQVVADDLDGLFLDGYKFLSNFQVEVKLAPLVPECVGVESPGCQRAAVGSHEVALQISNHYGTFAVQTTVIVFP